MRLWRRASGAIKDRNSIWIATLSKRTALRHPEIEADVVKATTHVESSLDRPCIDRALEHIRRSPFNLRPFLRSLASRMEKTRSWAVALKGLHLMHLIINGRYAGVNRIGRLPFDLSDFKDAHSSQTKTWSFNVFVRNYYAFLDHKSSLLYDYMEEFQDDVESEDEERRRERPRPTSITRELVILNKLVQVIDKLIPIKPQSRAADAPLVLEVMEEITIEIFKIYSRMCGGVTAIVDNIGAAADKMEAVAVLNAVQKASLQSEQLALYFEQCDKIGVINSGDMSFINKFSEEGIKNLEQRVCAQIRKQEAEEATEEEEEEEEGTDEKAIVVVNGETNHEWKDRFLKTIITHKWEKFDEDYTANNPFLSMVSHGKNQELPDLIVF